MRLNQEARKAGVKRILLSVQYGDQEVENLNHIPGDVAAVEDCSRDLGMEVVDEFDAMKTLSKDELAKFEQEYVREERSHLLGHKSNEGNRHVAERSPRTWRNRRRRRLRTCRRKLRNRSFQATALICCRQQGPCRAVRLRR
jgi:hypothetical protein